MSPVLYCQPIAQVDPGAAHGPLVEMLVRFRDEEEGLVPPGSFLPVLDDAIRQLSGMRDQGVGYVKFNSFNLLRAGADTKALDALRIEFAQGFAIAPPMPMAKAFGR